MPFFDGRSGKIDARVLEHWKKYDLRLVLRKDWAVLAPKLRGKLRIWVGDADEYFLNNAVHRLDAFLRGAKPDGAARIRFGPGKGHDWRGVTEEQTLREMAEAVERARPRE